MQAACAGKVGKIPTGVAGVSGGIRRFGNRLRRFRLGLRRVAVLRRCFAERGHDTVLDLLNGVLRFGFLLRQLHRGLRQLIQKLDLLIAHSPDGSRELLQLLLAFPQTFLRGGSLVFQAVDPQLGVDLRLRHHLIPLLFGFLHNGIRHPLSGEQGGPHGILGGAVFLHLLHQNLQLGLQSRVLFIKGGIIVRQLV